MIFTAWVRHADLFAVYGVAVGRMRWSYRYHPTHECPGNERSTGALR